MDPPTRKWYYFLTPISSQLKPVVNPVTWPPSLLCSSGCLQASRLIQSVPPFITMLYNIHTHDLHCVFLSLQSMKITDNNHSKPIHCHRKAAFLHTITDVWEHGRATLDGKKAAWPDPAELVWWLQWGTHISTCHHIRTVISERTDILHTVRKAISWDAARMRTGAPLWHSGVALSPVKQIKAIMVNRAWWWCSQVPQLALFAEPGASSLSDPQEMTTIDLLAAVTSVLSLKEGLKKKHRWAIKAGTLVSFRYWKMTNILS